MPARFFPIVVEAVFGEEIPVSISDGVGMMLAVITAGAPFPRRFFWVSFACFEAAFEDLLGISSS